MVVTFQLTDLGDILVNGHPGAANEHADVLIVVQVMSFKKGRRVCKGWRTIEDKLTEAIGALKSFAVRCGKRRRELFLARAKQFRRLRKNQFKDFRAAVERAIESGYIERTGARARRVANPVR